MVTDAERIKAGSPIPALWRLAGDGTALCSCGTPAVQAIWQAGARGGLKLAVRCASCGRTKRPHGRRRNALTNR